MTIWTAATVAVIWMIVDSAIQLDRLRDGRYSSGFFEVATISKLPRRFGSGIFGGILLTGRVPDVTVLHVYEPNDVAGAPVNPMGKSGVAVRCDDLIDAAGEDDCYMVRYGPALDVYDEARRRGRWFVSEYPIRYGRRAFETLLDAR